MARFAEAIEEARVDVVPKVVIGSGPGANGSGGSGLGGSTVFEALLALLLSDRVGVDVTAAASAPSAEAQRVRDGLRAKLAESR